jgi:hypothetical protein
MRTWRGVLVAVASYVLFISSVLQIAVSGIGYHFFDDSILIFRPKFNYRIMFGIGIGISSVVFIGIWIFFLIPAAKYNYIVTFPLFFILSCVFLYSSRSGAVDVYLEQWDSAWSDSTDCESFQIDQKCCGWANAFDRSVRPCPRNFESGCMNIMREWLIFRLYEIRCGAAVMFICGAMSLIVTLILIYRRTSSPVLLMLQTL